MSFTIFQALQGVNLHLQLFRRPRKSTVKWIKNDLTTYSFCSSFFKGKNNTKSIFSRPALIQFHWFRGEYLMDQLNLDVNKWTSCRVLELCPDGAARCPLSHCLWEDWRRRSEYVDPLKMLGRNTRTQQYSVTAGCVFCSSNICSSLRKKCFHQKRHFTSCMFVSGKNELSEGRRECKKRGGMAEGPAKRGVESCGWRPPWEQGRGRK